ncbi:hypothetical protein HZS_3611 [Henneguya salminicola]|nr:hypothetical protein HZS_3611 [Henneguya salminicola]
MILLAFIQLLILNNCEKNIKCVESTSPEAIYVITLSGSLQAMSLSNGSIFWRKNNEEIISVYYGFKNPFNLKPFLVPNPTDGSLHVFQKESSDSVVIKQISPNIQELALKPSLQLPNGLVQTGHKQDTWREINPMSGEDVVKLVPTHNISYSENMEKCIKPLVLSKTQYFLSLHRLDNKKTIVNITFHAYNNDLTDIKFNYLFLASPDGSLVAVDKINSRIIWKISLDSTPIHIFNIFPNSTQKLKIIRVTDQYISSLIIGASFNIDHLSRHAVHITTTRNDYVFTLQSHDPYNNYVDINHTHPIKNLSELNNVDLEYVPIANEADQYSLILFSEYIDYINPKMETGLTLHVVYTIPETPPIKNNPIRYGPIYLAYCFIVCCTLFVAFCLIVLKQKEDYEANIGLQHGEYPGHYKIG